MGRAHGSSLDEVASVQAAPSRQSAMQQPIRRKRGVAAAPNLVPVLLGRTEDA